MYHYSSLKCLTSNDCVSFAAADIATLFAKSVEGGPLYLNPEVVTPLYSTIFIINLWLNLSWIFIWDGELLIAASVFLFLIAITNIAALAVIANQVAKERFVFKTLQHKSYWYE